MDRMAIAARLPYSIYETPEFPEFLDMIVASHGELGTPAELAARLASPTDPKAPPNEQRKNAHRIWQNFPTGAPLSEQAAYLVRGIALLGLLDSQTVGPALDTLRRFFEKYRVPLRLKVDDEQELQRLLEEHADGFSRHNLLDRDRGFRDISEFFAKRLAARTER